MSTIDKQSLNVNDFKKAKEKQFQKQIIFLFLMLHSTTASMVTKATCVPKESIPCYTKDYLYLFTTNTNLFNSKYFWCE